MFDRIENTVMTNKAKLVQNDIIRRYKICKPNVKESESTMREFISPILIAAVELMADNVVVDPTDELKIKCDKRILGYEYSGPVDYVILFNTFNILVTEAKNTYLHGALL